MSLQVWLPLNGNLYNYGLSNVSVTNNGATVNDYGKIGKCYSFNGSTNNLSFTPKVDGLSTFSICLWLCPSSSTPSGVFFSLERDTYWQVTFVNNTIGIRDNSVGYSGSRKNFSTGTYAANTWTHLAVTYDHGTLNIYRDGVLLSTNSVGGTQLNTLINNCRIGSAVQSGYYHSGKINDVRIYDNCLSAKEVKDISKGLVLHYTMDENVQQLNNCFSYPTFNTSAASGGWSHWAPSGSTGSYSQNTDKTYIYNKNQTYSHKVSHLTGTYYICYQSPAFEGGFRSVQAIIKLEDGSNPKGKVSFSHNANVLNKPTEYIELGDGFYLMKKQGFKQDGSNDLVSIYISNNAVVYISEAYLENDMEACSDILSLRSAIVHDTSGYCNDGVITGTLTLSTDTPRYNLSTEFGSDRCILPSLWPSFLTNEATVSMWVKLDQLPPSSPGRTMLYTAWYGFSCEINSSGKTYFRTYLSNSGTTDSPQGTIGVGEWVHWVGVKSSTGVSLYLNGILIGTTSNTNNFNWSSNQSNKIASYSNSYFTYGKISDLRLYATALSADDIKELYDTAAFIDNLGNVSCYEFEEQNENLLKYEYTLLNTREYSRTVDTRGKYTYRNGEVAMAFQAKDTYFASGDERNSLLLYGFFKENTRYVFDLWMDVDDIISGNANRVGGFSVIYTDGTSSTALNATGATGSRVGWIHKVFISAADKSVKSLTIPYYTSIPFFVRADSFITPIYDTDIKNTGVIDTGQFIENTDIAFIGRGDVNSNKFLEI